MGAVVLQAGLLAICLTLIDIYLLVDTELFTEMLEHRLKHRSQH